jgi:hypothetical protein
MVLPAFSGRLDKVFGIKLEMPVNTDLTDLLILRLKRITALFREILAGRVDS